MPVENFDLRHSLDDLEPIVGLLRQGVAKEVQLLQEGEPLQELEEDVQVAQLVVADEEHLEELKPADALYVRKLIVLAVEFFDSEIGRNVVEVL